MLKRKNTILIKRKACTENLHIATYQYLNFLSHHQPNSTYRLISSLFSRAEFITSSRNYPSAENERIITVLRNNNYSKRHIPHQKEIISKKIKPNEIITLIFLILKIQAKHLREYSDNIHCMFYTSNTLRKMMSHPKDRVQPKKQNNIEYLINC